MSAQPLAAALTAPRLRDHASGVARRDLIITGGRLLLVPPMILTLGRAPIVTAALLFVFVVVDYFDGVIARRDGADDVGRRLLDTIVDRISIHTMLGVAVVVGFLPPLMWLAFAAREVVAARLLGRLLRRNGLVIRADSLYRGLNLTIATWGALAPWLNADSRAMTFGFVLLMSAIVLADIVRACAVVARGEMRRTGVVPAAELRRAARRAEHRAAISDGVRTARSRHGGR